MKTVGRTEMFNGHTRQMIKIYYKRIEETKGEKKNNMVKQQKKTNKHRERKKKATTK